MIARVCLSPRVFDLPDGTDPETYYASVISLARTFEDNCVLLIDSEEERVTTSAITDRIRSWPSKYKKPIQELLQRLRTQQRFVKVHRGYTPAPICNLQPCRHVCGMSLAGLPEVYIAPTACQSSLDGSGAGVELVTPLAFQLSRFLPSCRERRSYALRNGEWTDAIAEERVFAPVLNSAKHVKVIDRYIGRSVPPGGSGGSASLGADYRRSLEWLARIFLRTASDNPLATFEVWCGLTTVNLLPEEIAASVTVLRDWESSMRSRGVPSFKLHIKNERPGAVMPHARYLITDQVSVLIERGFDLLYSDTEMRACGLQPSCDARPLRDTTFALIRATGELTAAIATLPEL